VRALALTVAALAALPALGVAQSRGISTNPRSATPPPAPRLGSPSSPDRRPGYAPRGRHDGRRSQLGDGRRSRPVVIVVSPYDGYGYAPGGYYGSNYIGRGFNAGGYGSASTTTYTGSYAPLAMRAEDTERADTTYVRYEPAPPADVPDVTAASPAAISLAVERVAGSMLRLRWTGRTAGVHDVTLVVADASRRVLAAQTVRAAPFSAVFDNAARVAFVGTTVVRADGTSTTTLVPVGRVRTVTPRAALPAIRRTGE
jgi:hypothetical protein